MGNHIVYIYIYTINPSCISCKPTEGQKLWGTALSKYGGFQKDSKSRLHGTTLRI